MKSRWIFVIGVLCLWAGAARSESQATQVLIWGGGTTRAKAESSLAAYREREKTWAGVLTLAEGYPRIVESKSVAGLKPGFVVVLLGACEPKEGAQVLQTFKTFEPTVYARAVTWSEPLSCPQQNPDRRAEASGQPRVESLCDGDWDIGFLVVGVEERQDDGTPLLPFEPSQPMKPYELLGKRYLFGDKRKVYRVVGRFWSDEEGEAALREVQTKRTYLYTGSYPPLVLDLGPYLATESRTCEINRNNPIIDPAWWIAEKNSLLLVGQETQCTRSRFKKSVTVVACDGMKNLVTDSVEAPCEASRVNTCVYPLEPGVFMFEHSFTAAGATQIQLRVYNAPKKKRLYSKEWGHDGGPETELLTVNDIDEDGVPEVVFSIAGTGERTSILKWSKGKFVEVKSP